LSRIAGLHDSEQEQQQADEEQYMNGAPQIGESEREQPRDQEY